MEFTDERKAEIKAAFEAHPARDGRLDFAEVHKFSSLRRSAERRPKDSRTTCWAQRATTSRKQTMSWEDVTKFLEDNL